MVVIKRWKMFENYLDWVVIHSGGNLQRPSLDAGMLNDELSGSLKGSNLGGIGLLLRPLTNAQWSLDSLGS
jgi:hypothetical protein